MSIAPFSFSLSFAIVGRNKNEKLETVLAPFLVRKEEAARLLGDVPVKVIDELIDAGDLQVHTLLGRELVKLDSIRQIASERDPEPIDYPLGSTP